MATRQRGPRSDRTHHIYLVPGFLGFANLGRLTYFGHVGRFLARRLAALGLKPRIHIVRPPPTASLPERAARVVEAIDATAQRGGAPIHLIGHSSGGLDVRLLTAPGVGLPTGLDVERLAARVRTVVTGRLLEDFTPGRRRAVRVLLRDVVPDQALMLQLTPEAMEVFNASVLQRPGVRYGAVVTQAARPSLLSTLGAGFDPAAQVTHGLYTVLHQIIASAPGRVSPRLAPHQVRVLRRAYGSMPSPDANDGLVPTLSQAWGPVIHAAVADHLDVLGHFRDAAHDPPHVDWLVSGSGYDRRHFEALWTDVAKCLAGPRSRERPLR